MDDLPQPSPRDARIGAALAACRTGALSPALALLHLCMACEDAPAVTAAIETADPPVPALAALARQRPGAWALVHSMLGTVDHSGGTVERFAASFDRAAALSPEASVALYSFGDPALLDAATAELTAWLRRRDLLRPDRAILDLGCGIGRVAGRIAPHVRRVVGVDISETMLAEARRRYGAQANLLLVRTAGRDLRAFADGAFDVVLAVDSFPYLTGALARRHVEEAARVLAPGGDLVIFNLSYRGDPAADRDDLRAWAAGAGLTIVEDGVRDLAIWDAPAFRLTRDAERSRPGE